MHGPIFGVLMLIYTVITGVVLRVANFPKVSLYSFSPD